MILNAKAVEKLTKIVLKCLAKAKSALEKFIDFYEKTAPEIEKLKKAAESLDDVATLLISQDELEEVVGEEND